MATIDFEQVIKIKKAIDAARAPGQPVTPVQIRELADAAEELLRLVKKSLTTKKLSAE